MPVHSMRVRLFNTLNSSSDSSDTETFITPAHQFFGSCSPTRSLSTPRSGIGKYSSSQPSLAKLPQIPAILLPSTSHLPFLASVSPCLPLPGSAPISACNICAVCNVSTFKPLTSAVSLCVCATCSISLRLLNVSRLTFRSGPSPPDPFPALHRLRRPSLPVLTVHPSPPAQISTAHATSAPHTPTSILIRPLPPGTITDTRQSPSCSLSLTVPSTHSSRNICATDFFTTHTTTSRHALIPTCHYPQWQWDLYGMGPMPMGPQ